MTRPAPTGRHPKKTSRDDGRRWNLLTTLQTIAAAGTTSRADIARSTGLTRASVSSLVGELIEEGLIHEIGTAPADGSGKPPTLLAVNPEGRHIVALDLSRRPARAAVYDLAGTVRHRATALDSGAMGDAAVETAMTLIEECLAVATAPVLGVGIGTPGILDPEGTVLVAGNLGWERVPLKRLVSQRFDTPVTVANDAHVAALAEYRAHQRGADSLVLVKIGEGIGAGLVINGVLHAGDTFVSGEIGHVVVEPDGITCRCGHRGCLETVAAVPAIVGRAGDGPDLPWDALALAARFGEEPVRASIETAGRAVGSVLAAAAALLDLGHVVIASELANASDVLVEAISRQLRNRLHPATGHRIDVSAASARTDLVLSGAMAVVLRDQLGVVL